MKVKLLDKNRRAEAGNTSVASSLALLKQNGVLRRRRKSQTQVVMEDRAEEATREFLRKKKADEEGETESLVDDSPRDTVGILVGLWTDEASRLKEEREKSQEVDRHRHHPTATLDPSCVLSPPCEHPS